MKILKRSNLKIKEYFDVKPIIVTCENCGTITKFKPNEVMSWEYRDSFGCGKLCGEKEWVICPICNKDIVLHEYHTK